MSSRRPDFSYTYGRYAGRLWVDGMLSRPVWIRGRKARMWAARVLRVHNIEALGRFCATDAGESR